MEKEYESIKDMWTTITKHFLSNDKSLIRTDNYITSSVPIVSILKHPSCKIEKNPKFSQTFADLYAKQMCDGDNDGDFVYTYHERLFNYKGINQINYIINSLRKNSETRRAIAITWDPDIDEKLEDVPCLQNIICTIENSPYTDSEYLNMTVLFRSHDMFLGLPMNAIGLSALMEKIANELNILVGKLIIISVNAHVYIKRDLNDMRKLISLN